MNDRHTFMVQKLVMSFIEGGAYFGSARCLQWCGGQALSVDDGDEDDDASVRVPTRAASILSEGTHLISIK